jgi:hypothetical protein
MMAICAPLLVYGLTHTPKPQYPVEIHHNVYIWSRVNGEPQQWWVSSDEDARNAIPFSMWNCCPDFDCSTVMWAGYVDETAKWEDRGTCKSIYASGLGFFNAKEIQ